MSSATPIQVTVGVPATSSLGVGSQPGMLGGRQAEGIVAQLHGDYYTQAYNGNLFYASNAGAGASYSIFSNTTFVGLALWNQSTSKNLVIDRVIVGLNAAAATAEGSFGYAWLPTAGYAIGTAAPISAQTLITATRGSAICGVPGQGTSVALALSGATLTTAMAWGRAAPFSSSTGAITTQIAIGGLVDEVQGSMIVPPGCFWAFTTSILNGGSFVGTVVWEEVGI